MEEFGKFILDKIEEISNKIEELGEDKCQDYGLALSFVNTRTNEISGIFYGNDADIAVALSSAMAGDSKIFNIVTRATYAAQKLVQDKSINLGKFVRQDDKLKS